MNLLNKFSKQPISVRIVEIWLMVVFIILGMSAPWFAFTLLLGVVIGLIIIYLIVFFFLTRCNLFM